MAGHADRTGRLHLLLVGFHDPGQDHLFSSWIDLNERFFHAITSAPVPVDMRALRALKRSALALDLYAFVSYRAFVAHRVDAYNS